MEARICRKMFETKQHMYDNDRDDDEDDAVVLIKINAIKYQKKTPPKWPNGSPNLHKDVRDDATYV